MKQFLSVQTLLLIGFSLCSWNWYSAANHRPTLPQFNDAPRTIRPEYDNPFVVSDEQLRQVLAKTQPRFLKKPTKVNFIDHGIRLWGSQVEFSDDSIDGPEMLNVLLDDREFRKKWGENAPALLRHTDTGIGVLTQQGRTTVSHVDHMMGTLAEIGVPLSKEVITRDGTGHVSDLLKDAVLNFQLNQREYEWTALAAAFYVVDASPWYSDEGQKIDFDTMAVRIMRQRQPLGVCYGQHRLYTLVMLLRIDEQIRNESFTGLLSDSMVGRVKDYLFETTRSLYRTQSLEGYWDGNWPDTKLEIPDPSTDELSRRILATGHVLEWWAMAPDELHPPRESIVRGAQWLARVIVEMDQQQIEKNYTFLTHAARSLALWRGKFADEVELDYPSQSEQFISTTNKSRE